MTDNLNDLVKRVIARYCVLRVDLVYTNGIWGVSIPAKDSLRLRNLPNAWGETPEDALKRALEPVKLVDK